MRGSTLQSNFAIGFLRRRVNLSKFAHLSGEVFIYPGSHGVKLSLKNPVGNLTTEAIVMIASLQ